MTVKQDVKARRREILGAHVKREHERTGRNAYEQWLDSIAGLAPVHEKINRRDEDERSRKWHEEFWRQVREKGSPEEIAWCNRYLWDPSADPDLARLP